MLGGGENARHANNSLETFFFFYVKNKIRPYFRTRLSNLIFNIINLFNLFIIF